MSVFAPYAQANVLSFLGLQASAQTIAPVPVPNSQTITLPEASIGVSGVAGQSKGDIVVDNNALATAAGPLGTEADAAESDFTGTDSISVYVVKDGDTLPVIAKMYGVSVNTIMWANDLVKGAKIVPGTTLVILPISGISYTVKKGDTLGTIAKKFKADADDIGKYNGLESDSVLASGDPIIIPDGELGTPTTASGSTSTPAKSTKGASAVLATGIPKNNNSQLPLVALGATRYVPGHDGPDLGNYFMRPVKGCTVTQGLHGANGVDIACPKGTPIMASAAGTVIIAKGSGWNGGFGSYVVIDHGNGTQTLYAHMSKVIATVGKTVAQGETIGLMGMTGEATGNHVHWEVHGAVNPVGANFKYGI